MGNRIKQTTSKIQDELDSARQRIKDLEQQLAENALQTVTLGQSEALYKSLFEHAPGGLVLSTIEGRIISCNEALARMYGYSLEEFRQLRHQGLKAIDFYAAPDERNKLVKILKAKGEVKGFETQFIKKDGGIIQVRLNMQALTFHEQPHILTTVFDVTEIKQTQAALQANQDYLQTLWDSVHVGMMLIDAQTHRIVDVSEFALHLMGRSRDEVLNKLCHNFVCPAQQGRCPVTDLGQLVEQSERHLLTKDNECIDIHKTVTRIQLEGREMLLESFISIQELKKAHQDIQMSDIRFESLYTLSQMTEGTEQDLLNYALEAAVRATASEIGYIYFLNDDETELSLHAWSKKVMPQCFVECYPEAYKVEDTGLWGEAVRQRKPIITNNYASSSFKKGIPKGHVPIANHMNLPIFEKDKIVLLAGVSNKQTDFTNEDVRQLTLLMEGVWNIIQRRKSQRALKEAHLQLEEKVKERTIELGQANEDLTKINEQLAKEIVVREQAEAIMKSYAERLSLAKNAGGIGVWEYNIEQQSLAWDDRMLELYDISPANFTGSYDSWVERIHPDDRSQAERNLQNAIANRIDYQGEYRIISSDQGIRHIRTAGKTLYDDNGVAYRMTGVGWDITQNRIAEQAIRESEQRFRSIFENDHAVMLLIDEAKAQIIDANPAAVSFYGYSRSALQGMKMTNINTLAEKDLREKLKSAQTEEQTAFIFRHRLAGGSIRDVEVFSGPVEVDGRRVLYSIVHDITERKQMEEQLREMATTDALTKAANRRHFIERSREEFSRCRRYEDPLSMLMLDIDYFKAVNDTYGHDAGDVVLQALAETCRETLREHDLFGRIGGEEFATVLLRTESDAAREIAERLRTAVEDLSISSAGATIRFTISVGVATLCGKDDNIEALLKRADTALYEAKRSGRNKVVLAQG